MKIRVRPRGGYAVHCVVDVEIDPSQTCGALKQVCKFIGFFILFLQKFYNLVEMLCRVSILIFFSHIYCLLQ